MDPQIALQEVRWQIENLRGAVNNNDTPGIEEALELLEENFDALDSWLRRGGHLPSDWHRDLATPIPTPGELY